MGDAPLYVKLLMYVFVAVYMVSVMLETTSGELTTMLQDRRKMGRGLLANLVIVPILGFILVRLLNLAPDIRIGIMMLAVSPGGLFALQFARISKGDRVFAVALVIVLTILAILITPLLADWLFPRTDAEGRPFIRIVLLFLLLVAAPLLAGRALQRLFPGVAPKLGRWLGLLSILIFIAAALLSGRFKTPAIKALDVHGIAAIVALTVLCWAVGWMLGGPEIRNRKVLAISTAMRNFGICVPVALYYFPGTEVIAPIMAFSGISIPMNMVFALVTGKMLRDPPGSAGSS
ncbi:MAG: bile acid:sodium symporter family protein [Candidatus Binatia bacterium]